MLQHYVQPLVDYLRLHPHWGEIAAFFVSFLESLALVGTIFPGSLTMTAIGTLIGASIVPPYTTLALASLGALCGDVLSFWIGRRYKEQIPKMWPFRKYPKWLKMSEEFFQRHGGKSIIIGRFVGPARSTIPLVAGLLKFSWLRFLAAAAPSAIMWAIAYTVPGILLGALAVELPPEKATEFVIIGILIVVLLWLIFWLIQRFFRVIGRFINRRIDRYWNWLNQHHSSKWFIQLITNQQQSSDHQQLTMSLLALLSAILFLFIFLSVIFHGAIAHLNKPLFYFFQSLRTKRFDNFFILVTLFGTPQIMILIGVLLSFVLALKKQWRTVCHLLAITFLAAAAVEFFKLIYFSSRPTGFLEVETNSSFPSGHTTLSMTILFFLAFLTTQRLKKSWHWIPYTLAGILVLLVAISRLYLGAHWLTDILGSLFLGTALLLCVIVSYRRMPKKSGEFHVNAKYWYSSLAIFLLLPWLFFSLIIFKQAYYRYTPYTPKIRISIAQWWKEPLNYLPFYRDNRFGKAIRPFNLQWADKLEKIKSLLVQNGWTEIKTKITVKTTFRHFVSKAPESQLPLLAQLYENKPPMVMFYKYFHDHQKIVVLRLWTSNVKFTENSVTLWIGEINYQKTKHKLKIFGGKRTFTHLQNGSKKLMADLAAYEKKILTVPRDAQPKMLQRLSWDGKILVIKPKKAER